VALLVVRPAGAQTETDPDLAAPARPPEQGRSIVVDALEGDEVRWDPAWRKFGWENLVASGALAGVAFGSLAIQPAEGRWADTNRFDRAARRAFGLVDWDSRNLARDASDVTLVLSVNQVIVDTFIVTWWGHNAGEVAWQMGLMNAEAIIFNSAINGLVSGITSRQRPYAYPAEGTPSICVGEGNEALDDCRENKRYRSFYSGHTSTTFTLAGLTCMHHAYLPLYGGGPGDALACVTGFTLATATGALRVVSDQHWTSDVLVGAAMGTFSGLAVPWILHYRTGDLPESGPDEVSLSFIPTPTGGMLTGVF